MELGQPGCIFGSATATPSGTKSAASWWSVMYTSTPVFRISATSSLQAMPQSTVTMTSGSRARARSKAAAVMPYPSSKRRGMKGKAQAPSARKPRVSTVVADMPSKSKSPNTTMRFLAAMAAIRPSATSSKPGMSRGFSQSRSSEGCRKSRAASGVSMPRPTRVAAMNRGRRRAF